MKLLTTSAILTSYALGFATLLSCTNNKKTPDAVAEATTENKEAGSDTNRKDDVDFAVNAADGGMYEVQLGQYAATHASSDAVKMLGTMMVTDHTKANAKLQELASTKGIVLPSVLSNKMQKKYDDITGKQGLDFDKAYASAMVSDHQDDLDLFKGEANSGKDEGLKTFAADKVPVLQHHLEMSKETKEKLRK